MTTFHILAKSKNAKTGPIPVSTTSDDTCPPSCPFNHGNEGGCYAAAGPLALHWRAVNRGERGGDLSALCETVAGLPEGQVWRHNQAGDLPGEGDSIDWPALGRIVEANKGRRGFTYTHKPVEGRSKQAQTNRAAVDAANHHGFTVNLSANNPAHADRLASLNVGPVVTVLPADVDGAQTRTLTTPEGRTIAVCPATYRDNVSCATCALCQKRDRKVIVGFPAHGATKARASRVASAA